MPGETTVVSFDVTPEMLAFTTLDMERKAENGDFVAMIGGSSVDLQEISFKLQH